MIDDGPFRSLIIAMSQIVSKAVELLSRHAADICNCAAKSLIAFEYVFRRLPRFLRFRCVLGGGWGERHDQGKGKAPAHGVMLPPLQARDFVRATVGAQVQLTSVRPGKYAGRVVADVWVNEQKLSDLLIAENMGRPYRGGRRRGWCP